MPKLLSQLVLIAWLVLQFSSVMAVTVSVRVEADNDDAEERISDGEMYRDSSDLELGFDQFVDGLQIVGMRFTNVAIPQGAIINSAYLEFTTDETDSGSINVVIFGENVNTADDFSDSDDDISDRARTAASADWNPSSWNSENELHQTPDISPIIKEIVDRDGWSSGNDLVIMIEPGSGCTDSSCQRIAESHDGDSGEAPLLVIDYSTGPPPDALTCLATFTDGLTNSDNGGKIKFEGSAQLIGNPDLNLATTDIDNNGSEPSCVSANCSASGTIVPQLNGSYIGYSSNSNLVVDNSTLTINASDYKDVRVRQGGSLFMSASFTSYHFKKLKVENNSFIYLTAGDYFLEQIDIKGSSQLIVQGAGTARIYVKNKAKFKESSITNGGASGDPSKLVVYFFGDDEDKIKVESGASFAGYIYSEKKVAISGNGSSVLGAISSVGELKLKDDTSVTYDNSIDDTDFGSMCAAGQFPEPLAEYRFDEFSWNGTTGEVIDSSENNHNGTAVGGITTVPGKICRAADIPSNTSASIYEAVDTGLDVNTTIGSIGTISLWYKGDSAWGTGPDKRLFSANNGGKYFFAEITSEARVIFFFEDGNDQDTQRSTVSTFAVAAGVWKHLAFAWDVTSSTVKIFVDGVDQTLSGQNSASVAFAGLDTLYLGDNRDASYLTGESSADGLIDEALVFDSVLGDGRIQTIFTNQNAGDNYDGSSRTCPIGATIGYFVIDHDNTASYCLNESIAVTAYSADTTVLEIYEGTVTLNTQTGSGTWMLGSGNGTLQDSVADDGIATYAFDTTDNGVANFSLFYPEGAAAINILVSDGAFVDQDGEGNLVYTSTAFTITASALATPPVVPINDPLGNQISGQNFVVHVAAYGTNPDNAQCGIIETYTGTKSITVTTDYNDPTTGTLSTLGTGNMTFTNGQASFTARYDDVGDIDLSITDSAESLQGSSNPFVVVPADFSISVTGNPGTTNTGTGFTTSGSNITINVQALNALGSPTPNYGNEVNNESVVVGLESLAYPAAGSAGVLTNGAVFNKISSDTFRNTTLNWNEFGSITLVASVQDGNYLGAGDVTSTPSGTVGRFFPAAFSLGTNSITAACNGFTYMSQPELSVFYVISALGQASIPLANYDTTLLGTATVASVGSEVEDANNGVNLAPRLSAGSTNWNSGVYTLSTVNAQFDRLASADGPYTGLIFGVSLVDPIDSGSIQSPDMNPATATDCVVDGNCNARVLAGTSEIKYGRLQVANAFGPETEPLDVTLRAQFFDAANFTVNTADNCTTYINSAATLANYQNGLPTISVSSPIAPVAMQNGISDIASPLLLSAPGASNTGSVDVTYAAPVWLKYNWDTAAAGDEDPVGVASFGYFRGNDRVVYWREVLD